MKDEGLAPGGKIHININDNANMDCHIVDMSPHDIVTCVGAALADHMDKDNISRQATMLGLMLADAIVTYAKDDAS